MTLIKDILIDFVLFSGIEGFIFCLFFCKIFNHRKFKFYEWFILSFINCLISKLLPPIIYQAVVILFMSIYLYILNNKEHYLHYLKMSGLSVAMFLVTEILYSIILNLVLKFNMLQFFMNDFELLRQFIFLIPLRIIEIINIFIIKEIKMKIILGGVVRK